MERDDSPRAGPSTGRKHTEETKAKMRAAHAKRTGPSPLKGRKMSAEARAAMSAAAKARPSNRLGKKHTLETRALISAVTRERTPRGEDAPGYIDGKAVERLGLRHSGQAKRWRYDVMLRDGFACQHCGDDRGGNLQAHHIKPFATHPELRFVRSNGITLCEGCHWLGHVHGIWPGPPDEAVAA